MSNTGNGAMNWDATIQNDSTFQVLPAGEYKFTVIAFERGWHNGSANLDPCNKAVLTIRLEGEGGATTLTHNLFLHTKTEGLLSAFFIAVGLRKHGEAMKMDFPKSIGRSGRCKVSVRTWTGNDGQPRESNQIDRFLEPEAGGFTPGAF